MNDLIDGARVEGASRTTAVDLYDDKVNPVEVRRRIGMVFQKPNPFPKSIYDNVAYGPRIAGSRRRQAGRHRRARRCGAPRSGTRSRTGSSKSALGLSGGQQQRLCIARALAVKPEVILMDEPCSALDPVATLRIEQLMQELKKRYTILIVTHNMQQAARVSDRTAFFSVDVDSTTGDRTGELVEYDRPRRSSASRRTSAPRTTSPAGSVEAGCHGRGPEAKGRSVSAALAFSAELDQLRLQVEVMAVRVDQNLERMRDRAPRRRPARRRRRRSTPTTTSTP